MNSLGKFSSLLRRNVWALLAFFVPLALRCVPEVLSWPYPLGLDTLRYIPVIESGSVLLSGPLVFVQSQLFYTLATLAYWIFGNPVVIIKVLGPLLMGSVAAVMFLFARRGLGWGSFKSFLVALLVGTYFVSLRNSWDLYAQSLALIFFFATLIFLKASNSPRRYIFAFVFMLMTVLSHQLISVILFFVLGLEAVRYLVKKSRRDFVFSFISLGLAGGLFFFRLYSFRIGSLFIPTASAGPQTSFAIALNMTGLLVYCYFLIIPLAAIGFTSLKSWVLRLWVIWCLGAIVLLMFFPNLPLYYWQRWVYLLVYPLLFFAVEGFDKLWHFWFTHKNKIKRLAPKAFALTYVALLLVLSGFYLAASPKNQISLFSTDNHYLAFIPSSMVQNTLPISDNPDLVECINWINNNAVNNSVIISHYALYDLTVLYGHDRLVIPVRQSPSLWVHLQNETTLVDGMIEASRIALAAGNSTVYTVWWINGDGWYKISALPSYFTEVYRSDRMAVYAVNASD